MSLSVLSLTLLLLLLLVVVVVLVVFPGVLLLFPEVFPVVLAVRVPGGLPGGGATMVGILLAMVGRAAGN